MSLVNKEKNDEMYRENREKVIVYKSFYASASKGDTSIKFINNTNDNYMDLTDLFSSPPKLIKISNICTDSTTQWSDLLIINIDICSQPIYISTNNKTMFSPVYFTVNYPINKNWNATAIVAYNGTFTEDTLITMVLEFEY